MGNFHIFAAFSFVWKKWTVQEEKNSFPILMQNKNRG